MNTMETAADTGVPNPFGGFTPEVVRLRQEIAVLLGERDSLRARNEFLEEENRLLRAFLYGRSSEKKPAGPTPEQPHLPFNEAEAAPPPKEEAPTNLVEVKGHVRQKPGRKPLPPNLPRVIKEVDLPESEKFSACGCPLKCIGYDESERLDIVPAKIFVVVTRRLKYAPQACQCPIGTDAGGEVKIAPAPPELIPHGTATAGLVAHVVTAKFVDAIPLYRQEQQLLRLGLDITRNTLCNWVRLAAAACARLLELLAEYILSGPVVNMDETRVQVLREPGRPNTSHSYMWVIRGGHPDRPGVMFRYDPSRGGRVPKEILRDYRGYLQTDGYSGYEAVGDREGIRHLGCWAHARRKFVEVIKGTKGQTKGGVAQEVLDLIKKLYAVEKAANEQRLSPEMRQALRQAEAKPVLDDIHSLLEQKSKLIPPRSLLGKAISYTLNQWPRLTVYLENGILRPDNNLAENAIRPLAVGRKNWMFSGSPRGAAGSATLYSLIETAKANGLEPYAYLRLLFSTLPTVSSDEELRALLPPFLDRSRLESFGPGGTNSAAQVL